MNNPNYPNEAQAGEELRYFYHSQMPVNIDAIYYYYPDKVDAIQFTRELKEFAVTRELLKLYLLEQRRKLLHSNPWAGLGKFKLWVCVEELGLRMVSPPAINPPAIRQLEATTDRPVTPAKPTLKVVWRRECS